MTKYKVLTSLDFRASKYKKNDLVEIPEGLAQKLILKGVVTKWDGIEVKKTPKEILQDEAVSLGINIDGLSVEQLKVSISSQKELKSLQDEAKSLGLDPSGFSIEQLKALIEQKRDK